MSDFDRDTTFFDRVRVVYGPVPTSIAVVDEDDLPKDGGWMRCSELTLTQHPEAKPNKAYFTMRATGNAELDGRTFHALAYRVTFDESKGLYVLSGDGKRDAKLWHEPTPGRQRNEQTAQRMEFNPNRNEVRNDRASGGQGIR